MIKPSEYLLVWWSFIYFFFLLSGYFVLRPLRDEMGIINGVSNMHWLFTGTFIVMLLIVPVFGYITRKNSIRKVLIGTYIFFIVNIILFYFLFKIYGMHNILAVLFFIWLSVFNLFIVSLFWSFMADVFSIEESKRLFGIIATGGSLGAIFGPILTSFFVKNIGLENLLLFAALFILLALMSILKIVKLKNHNRSTTIFFSRKLESKGNILEAIRLTFSSSYLMGIVAFVVLYTSISTILYFEQAHILEDTIINSNDRVAYFSKIDLSTNILAVIGQFILINRFIKHFGLAIALALIPILISIGLLLLSGNQQLYLVGAILVLHRAGNFSILRPCKEILFTVTTRKTKYRAKNFIDTAVYRGGDAFTGWVFATFLSIGLGLSTIALMSVFLCFLWTLIGFKLGKKHAFKENLVINNFKDGT